MSTIIGLVSTFRLPLQSHLSKVQIVRLTLPFWTLTRLPAASTSDLPRLGFPFGLQHAFPPLQRPIRRALASLLDFNAPSLYFNVQSTTPWLTIIPARQKAPARMLFTSILAGANPHMYHKFYFPDVALSLAIALASAALE